MMVSLYATVEYGLTQGKIPRFTAQVQTQFDERTIQERVIPRLPVGDPVWVAVVEQAWVIVVFDHVVFLPGCGAGIFNFTTGGFNCQFSQGCRLFLCGAHARPRLHTWPMGGILTGRKGFGIINLSKRTTEQDEMKNFPSKTAQDQDMREAVQQAIAHFRATGERCFASAFGVLLWHSDRP